MYNDTASVAFGTLDTSEKGSGTAYDYLFLGDPTDPEDTVKYGGSAEDFTVLDVAGKIVLISRGGGVNFADKQKYARADAVQPAPSLTTRPVPSTCPCPAKPPVSPYGDQMESIWPSRSRMRRGATPATWWLPAVWQRICGGNRRRRTMSSFSSWGVPQESDAEAEVQPWQRHYSTGRRPIWS
ncbi:MAG: hypothetical protein ACLU9S_22745 [Oscillospiraceae bacterium]